MGVKAVHIYISYADVRGNSGGSLVRNTVLIYLPEGTDVYGSRDSLYGVWGDNRVGVGVGSCKASCQPCLYRVVSRPAVWPFPSPVWRVWRAVVRQDLLAQQVLLRFYVCTQVYER